MKLAAACLLVLVAAQTPRVKALRDALVFGVFDAPNVEAITDPAAAARWVEVQRRAERSMSRLRPPPEPSGTMSMVWGKRQQYERLFNATAAVRGNRSDDNLWVAEEVADFVEGMRPCYEWEGSSACPHREAEFAELWLRHHPQSSFAAFLPLFAGNRFLCAAEGFDYEKEPARATDARKRGIGYLTQAAAGKDPLFKLAATQMLANPRCLVRS